MKWDLGSSHPKIAVVGDVMLDRYLFCEACGLTPEDPIAPKLRLQHTKETLGGAANVASNLVALGAQVTLLSVVGDDQEGQKMELDLNVHNISFFMPRIPNRPTTVKTRLIAYPENRLQRKVVHPEGRYICRVDNETTDWIDKGPALDGILRGLDKDFDMVVVSDYNKGVVVPSVINALRGKSYIVDPKKKNLVPYGPALVLTPNSAETSALETMQHLGKVMMVTRSGKGAVLMSSDAVWNKTAKELREFQVGDTLRNLKICDIPVRYRTEGDATGCGDSAIAGLAFGLAAGLELLDAAYLAMACGACAVDQEGIKAVKFHDVMEELTHEEYDHEG